MVVGAIGEIQHDGLPGQEFPPEQSKAFLDEAGDDRNEGGSRKYTDVEQCLPDEFGLAAVRDRGHEFSADVTVDNVHAIDPEQERDEPGEHQFGFPADLGVGKVFDCLEEMHRGDLQRSFLLLHVIPLTSSMRSGPVTAAAGRVAPGKTDPDLRNGLVTAETSWYLTV